MLYRFAEFEIDLSQQELRRLGLAVHIEPQVFDLIVHLVRNRDRIVSKDELIETIWNGRIISEAALSSRINGARRALGDTGADQALIRTLHKRGFRFVGDVQTVGAAETDAKAARVVPGNNVASGDVAAGGPVSLEVSRLDDVVSESVKAEAITRSSIAVLPFGNMSDDPENDYFSYGLTEDIIRLLARNRWLSVISRHSTIAFQGRAVDAREVGEQLGVRYVMVGSVRKSRDTVRITAELVRAADGKQLWSDKYDLQLEYIFDIQEEMARQIAATIEPELSKVEQQLAARKAPENLDAWDCYQRGLWNLWRFTTPGFDWPKPISSVPSTPIRTLHAAMARSATSICSARLSTSRKIARRGWKQRCARGVMRWRSMSSIAFATARSDESCARPIRMTKRWRRSMYPWSSIQALRRPISPKGSTCSGTGGSSKQKRCSIERPC